MLGTPARQGEASTVGEASRPNLPTEGPITALIQGADFSLLLVPEAGLRLLGLCDPTRSPPPKAKGDRKGVACSGFPRALPSGPLQGTSFTLLCFFLSKVGPSLVHAEASLTVPGHVTPSSYEIRNSASLPPSRPLEVRVRRLSIGFL